MEVAYVATGFVFWGWQSGHRPRFRDKEGLESEVGVRPKRNKLRGEGALFGPFAVGSPAVRAGGLGTSRQTSRTRITLVAWKRRDRCNVVTFRWDK